MTRRPGTLLLRHKLLLLLTIPTIVLMAGVMLLSWRLVDVAERQMAAKADTLLARQSRELLTVRAELEAAQLTARITSVCTTLEQGAQRLDGQGLNPKKEPPIVRAVLTDLLRSDAMVTAAFLAGEDGIESVGPGAVPSGIPTRAGPREIVWHSGHGDADSAITLYGILPLGVAHRRTAVLGVTLVHEVRLSVPSLRPGEASPLLLTTTDSAARNGPASAVFPIGTTPWGVEVVAREFPLTLPSGSLDPLVKSTQDNLATMLILWGGFVLVTVVVIGTMVVKQVSTPVMNIADAADALARGDLHRRVPAEGSDEISALAHAFNEMAARLEATLEGMRENQQKLETVLQRFPGVVFWKNRRSVYQGCNAAFAAGAGLSGPAEIVGKTDFDLPWAATEGEAYRADDQAVMASRGAKLDIVETQRQANGTVLWFNTSKLPLFDAAGEVIGVLGVSTDISARKRDEERIAAQNRELTETMERLSAANRRLTTSEETLRLSLQEKDVLLRELYHRTKNTLNLICSMLNLRGEESGDRVVSGILAEMVNRIRSMALVHQKLYQAKNLSRINLREYIHDLASLLADGLDGGRERITLREELEDAPVLIDVAVPCGLVLTELLTNAFTHAFPGDRAGTVTLRLCRRSGNDLQLEVEDDGVGLPAGFRLEDAHSMGLTTVVALVEQQLQGSVTMASTPGTRCTIRLSESHYTERV